MRGYTTDCLLQGDNRRARVPRAHEKGLALLSAQDSAFFASSKVLPTHQHRSSPCLMSRQLHLLHLPVIGDWRRSGLSALQCSLPFLQLAMSPSLPLCGLLTPRMPVAAGERRADCSVPILEIETAALGRRHQTQPPSQLRSALPTWPVLPL